MKSYMKISILLIMIIFMPLFNGCGFKNAVNAPDKIIIYKNGIGKEIPKNNKNFNTIVKLTNDRINSNKLGEMKDEVSDWDIYRSKDDDLSIEFIYAKEQKMDTKRAYLIYYKIFFPLKTKDGYNDVNVFQLGDSENYGGSSVGFIKSPDKLIKLINSI